MMWSSRRYPMQIEPLGPMPALTGNVPIRTPCGYRRVGHLKRGDLILTEMGETVPVLHVIRRRVPARGSFRPVRLRAPYFGLRQDVIVAPHQRLVLSGSQVEYTFGREAVLVPARYLINGVSALAVDGPDELTYHQLLLPDHEVLLAAGCPMESLYIGRLRRKPEQLAASLLARNQSCPASGTRKADMARPQAFRSDHPGHEPGRLRHDHADTVSLRGVSAMSRAVPPTKKPIPLVGIGQDAG